MHYRVTIRKEGQNNEVRDIEAPNRFVIYDQVRDEGGLVVTIEERQRLTLAWLNRFNLSFGSGVKRAEIIRLAKNLSAMLSAGLSISRALSVIERQSSNKRLKAMVSSISESVKQGLSFHESLAAYPSVFPPVFGAMARVGEESGSLADSLTTVATQMERSEELTRKIKGAMIYPAIVITAVLIVGILMLIYVVPTLTGTFTKLGVQIPLATRIIVALSDFMAAHVALVFVALFGVFAGGYAFVKTRFGSNMVLATVLHLPVIGDLARETYTARAARTISSLLSAGVPVLEALTISKEVVRADAFANVIDEASEHVRKGESISTAFAEHTEYYPILMSEMLAVGEETGKVSEMLKQIALFYEEDVSEKTKDLSTIIEPVLMLVIGTFVGIFAVSMISPIYQLSSAIN